MVNNGQIRAQVAYMDGSVRSCVCACILYVCCAFGPPRALVEAVQAGVGTEQLFNRKLQ